jgi:DNA-directed RNA polymerase specialized sigma24 family protein
MAEPNEDEFQAETLSVLKGIFALLLEQRELTKNPFKVELTLARSGLSYKEIAALTGKKQDTVRKSIERARPAEEGADGGS